MSSHEPRWWATELEQSPNSGPGPRWAPCRANITAAAGRGRAGPDRDRGEGWGHGGADSDIVLELGWPGPTGCHGPGTSREWDFSQEEEGTGLRGDSIAARDARPLLVTRGCHLSDPLLTYHQADTRAQCIHPSPVRRGGITYQMQSINLWDSTNITGSSKCDHVWGGDISYHINYYPEGIRVKTVWIFHFKSVSV